MVLKCLHDSIIRLWTVGVRGGVWEGWFFWCGEGIMVGFKNKNKHNGKGFGAILGGGGEPIEFFVLFKFCRGLL